MTDTDDTQEYERRKRAIFDGMAKRGRERILRMGYENWEPFQEPKDPRERIFGSTSVIAGALLNEFFEIRASEEVSPVLRKELFELCRGLLQGDDRAKMIYEFCNWYREKNPSV